MVLDYIKKCFFKHRTATIALCGIIAIIMMCLILTRLTPYAESHTTAFSDNSGRSYYARVTVLAYKEESIKVKILDGPMTGSETELRGSQYLAKDNIPVGASLLVQFNGQTAGYAEFWRVPGLILLIVLFLIIVAVVGRRKGVMSFIGLSLSIVILLAGVVPAILSGFPTFSAILLGAFLISVTSIYIAHGISRRTTVSVISIIGVLMSVAFLSWVSIILLGLTGKVDEVAANLALSHPGISLSGLLSGSIVIATLGILDDVVTTQVAFIHHLYDVHPKISKSEALARGMDIGREHVAALVNTLALAYAGISLPLVIIYTAGAGYASPLLFLNSEFFAQEIARTIISSSGLLLAGPFSTYMAVVWMSHRKKT